MVPKVRRWTLLGGKIIAQGVRRLNYFFFVSQWDNFPESESTKGGALGMQVVRKTFKKPFSKYYRLLTDKFRGIRVVHISLIFGKDQLSLTLPLTSPLHQPLAPDFV